MEDNNGIIKINRKKSQGSKSLTTTHQTDTSIVALFNKTIKFRDIPADSELWKKVGAALNKASVIIGVPSVLTDQEYFTIKEFLIDEYKDFSAEEIIEAFKKLSSGKIKVEIDHYGKLSPIYLGAVLRAYKEMRYKAIAEAERNAPKEEKEASEEDKKAIREEFLKNCLIKPYKAIEETGAFEVDKKTASMLFKLFRRANLIDVKPFEEIEYEDKAVLDLKAQASTDYKGHKPVQKFFEAIQLMNKGQNEKMQFRVTERACALYFIDHILKLKSNNRDIEQIAKQL